MEKIIHKTVEKNRTVVLEQNEVRWEGRVEREDGMSWYVRVSDISRLINKYSKER